MAKTWEEMTQPEKIEDLHSDVKRILHIINQYPAALATDHERLAGLIDALSQRLSALEQRARP
jgi:hypothetical protein